MTKTPSYKNKSMALVTKMISFVLGTSLHTGILTTPPSSPCINCHGVDVTCVDGECPPRCVNVTSSGECLQCWDSRFYGKQCENVCPYTCLNSRCQLNNSRVVCTEGCVAGKKGDNCGVDCPAACAQCERYRDNCFGNCSNPWYYGARCEMLCPGNCNGGCYGSTGVCYSCITGYSGKSCKEACSPHCEDGCDRFTGYCHGCESSAGCDICDKDTGHCRQCSQGHCRSRCDEPCIPCTGEECHNPSCLMVCPANCNTYNLARQECTSPCINNHFYGKQCNNRCPLRCDGCDKITGECINCTLGLMGSDCDISCPFNCSKCERYENICIGPCREKNRYGRDCSLPCSVGCNGCYKDTGICVECAQGFSRTYCDEVCTPCQGITCHNITCMPRVTDVTFSSWSIITLAVILVLVLATIVLVTFWFVCTHNRSGSVGPCNANRSAVSSLHSYCEINVNDMDSDPAQTTSGPPRTTDNVMDASGTDHQDAHSLPAGRVHVLDTHSGGSSSELPIERVLSASDIDMCDTNKTDISNTLETRKIHQSQSACTSRIHSRDTQEVDALHGTTQASGFELSDCTSEAGHVNIKYRDASASVGYLTPEAHSTKRPLCYDVGDF